MVLVIFLIANFSAHAQQAPILAAASSFRTLWPSLMESYVADTGEPEPKVSFGSSGLLSTQLINGAPFELFLSADLESVHRIPQQLLVTAPQVFALGTLQLAVPQNSDLADNLSMSSLAELLSKTTEHQLKGKNSSVAFRIAIPNPLHAPYGKAAQEALEHAQAWPLPQGALVAAENASQTLQFLKTGAVSAAILPQALVHNNAAGLVSVAVPAQSYERVEHVLATLSSDNASATLFGRWLLGVKAQSILQNAGLQINLP